MRECTSTVERLLDDGAMDIVLVTDCGDSHQQSDGNVIFVALCEFLLPADVYNADLRTVSPCRQG